MRNILAWIVKPVLLYTEHSFLIFNGIKLSSQFVYPINTDTWYTVCQCFVPTVAPVVVESPHDASGMIDDSVVFTCTVTGIPLPTITWSSDTDGDITTSTETILNMTTIYSEIIISDVQVDDFINYTCTAENQFGSVNATAMLVNASMLLVDLVNTQINDIISFSCSNSDHHNSS